LQAVTVRLRHSRVHAEDCAACEAQDAKLTVIDRDIELDGTLDENQRARLLSVANRCPVHLTLDIEDRYPDTITVKELWPPLPYGEWAHTCATLHSPSKSRSRSPSRRHRR
jgi:hypothetical protein